MSNEKKKKADELKAHPPEIAESDPLACLRLPAQPPKRNVTAFVISLLLFLTWFGYLVMVAWYG